MDIKKQFLSVFAAYVQHTQGCSADSAKKYADYVEAANRSGMCALGIPDYLLWLAECSNLRRAMEYVREIERGMSCAPLKAATKDNYFSALRYLERFVKERLREKSLWTQCGADYQWRTVIRYEKGTATTKQVPGLYVALKNEYLRIVELAQTVFGKLLDDAAFLQIPVVLSPEMPTVAFPLDEEYLDKLRRRRQEREDLTEEENAALHEGVFVCRLIGQFCDQPEPAITLYYRNVGGADFGEYLAALANALAHEYLHYLHTYYCNKIGETGTLADAALSEAMAEFFAMLYSLYRDRDADLLLSRDAYWGWIKWWGSRWPYADALAFCPDTQVPAFVCEHGYSWRFLELKKYGCLDKLVNVLAMCDRPAMAHDTLFY